MFLGYLVAVFAQPWHDPGETVRVSAPAVKGAGLKIAYSVVYHQFPTLAITVNFGGPFNSKFEFKESRATCL